VASNVCQALAPGAPQLAVDGLSAWARGGGARALALPAAAAGDSSVAAGVAVGAGVTGEKEDVGSRGGKGKTVVPRRLEPPPGAHDPPPRAPSPAVKKANDELIEIVEEVQVIEILEVDSPTPNLAAPAAAAAAASGTNFFFGGGGSNVPDLKTLPGILEVIGINRATTPGGWRVFNALLGCTARLLNMLWRNHAPLGVQRSQAHGTDKFYRFSDTPDMYTFAHTIARFVFSLLPPAGEIPTDSAELSNFNAAFTKRIEAMYADKLKKGVYSSNPVGYADRMLLK
jgi:hypothetical protein